MNNPGSMDGEAVVLAASSEFEELHRHDLGEGSHSTPAIARGRLYLRTFGHLISLGGRR
jgi:outer membrane protein assembly factor BamB